MLNLWDEWVILLNTLGKVHLLRGVFWALLNHFQRGLRLVTRPHLETALRVCAGLTTHVGPTPFSQSPRAPLSCHVRVMWYLSTPAASSVPCGERTVLLPHQGMGALHHLHRGTRWPWRTQPRDWSWSYPVSSVREQSLIPSAHHCITLLGDCNTKTPWAEHPPLMTDNRCHLLDKHTWENLL